MAARLWTAFLEDIYTLLIPQKTIVVYYGVMAPSNMSESVIYRQIFPSAPLLALEALMGKLVGIPPLDRRLVRRSVF